MSIPFTQYLLPNGRKKQTEIDMPQEIEDLAQRFIDAGGWYESEMLRDMEHVSLTACWNRPDGDNDIAIKVVKNGPQVVDAVEQLVQESIKFVENMKD